MTVAHELVGPALAIQYEDIPTDILEHLKLHLADGVGCAVAALNASPVLAGHRMASESGAGPCTVIGVTTGAGAEDATFVNSLAVRCLDYCDVYLGREVTPPAATGPVALALTELTGGDGRDLLANFAAVYETLLRLCDAASLRQRGWDTVFFGALAAAVGASRALGLGQAAAEQAVAIAATAGAGLLRARLGRLSTWKSAASANAARYGVFSARLAAHGITGPDEVFEGGHGVFEKVTGPFQLPAPGWRVANVLLKRYPAQVFTQAAIEAAASISRRVRSAEIVRVSVVTYQRAVEGSATVEAWSPMTAEAADHSLPFVVAIALIEGNVVPDDFHAGRYLDSDVRALMARVSVHEDSELTRCFPREMVASVQVTTRNGTVAHEEVRLPTGHPNRPMDRAGVRDKFLALCSPRLGTDTAAQLFEMVTHLDESDNGLSDLIRVLRAA